MQRQQKIRASNIQAAIGVTESLSTSLGPRGLDKLLITGNKTLITNDGATILKTMSPLHPITKILCNVAKAQDEACGDGTTSVVVLTGCLLRSISGLLERGVHPTQICRGLERVKEYSMEYVKKIAIPIGQNSTPDLEINDYIKSAVTSLSSKVVSTSATEMAPVAVEAVLKVKGNLRDLKVVKKMGSLEDIKIHSGVVLNASLNENPFKEKKKIVLIKFCISAPKTNLDSKIIVNDYALMDRIIKEERAYILDICKKIKMAGIQMIIVQKSILRESVSELAMHFLKRLGILVVNDVEREEMEFLERSLCVKPVSEVDLLCDKNIALAEVELTEDILSIYKPGMPTCSVVVRASEDIILDEAERSLNDALCVVKCLVEDPYLVPGGGAIEIGISKLLAEKSLSGGDDGIILSELGRAFEGIPYYLARNAGLNPIDIISELKGVISTKPTMGVDIRRAGVGCMVEEDVIQPLKVSRCVVSLAIETVMMILKIDDILPSI
ncbi:T-complex protein 1 subunit delta [Astathelohania contejeani]|uniref:T-complex protein 1 subunit delta n=1 Tax=Astathelohania contejeani TaxID=164912 RepID=A0ABQ7I0J3_9MICR|nr:T-complex protein 1 subunit delta [Thelohania contejeani]